MPMFGFVRGRAGATAGSAVAAPIPTIKARRLINPPAPRPSAGCRARPTSGRPAWNAIAIGRPLWHRALRRLHGSFRSVDEPFALILLPRTRRQRSPRERRRRLTHHFPREPLAAFAASALGRRQYPPRPLRTAGRCRPLRERRLRPIGSATTQPRRWDSRPELSSKR